MANKKIKTTKTEIKAREIKEMLNALLSSVGAKFEQIDTKIKELQDFVILNLGSKKDVNYVG